MTPEQIKDVWETLPQYIGWGPEIEGLFNNDRKKQHEYWDKSTYGCVFRGSIPYETSTEQKEAWKQWVLSDPRSR